MRTNKIKLNQRSSNYSLESLEEQFYKKEEFKINRTKKKKSINQFDLLHKKPGKHSKGLLKILHSPELIGISDYFYHARPEVSFFKKNIPEGSADVYLETKNQQYIIEYKCNDHKKNRQKAKDQLQKAEKYLKLTNQIDKNKPTTLLYVFGNKFITYELKNYVFQHKNTPTK